jgi:EAL domain-containing protein (putative c-di-GMP-specific phosphodiesterase class I)
LPGERLCIEVTESAFMRDVSRSVVTLQKIAGLGVEIAMDDFGTGYSSLSSLRSFAFGRLKIDRAFVRDLARSADARAILKTIVDLANVLGMQTTAEGVETLEQLEIVTQYGCSGVQGYIFYKPMPLAELKSVVFGSFVASSAA